MAYRERMRKKNKLDLEGDLFASIATLDRVAREFSEGNIDDSFYKRQLKGLLRDAFKARMMLEQVTDNFSVEDFISKHKLHEKYPLGIDKLQLAEGGAEDATSIPFAELKQLPAKVADFVANSIELLDLLQLKSVARVELIVPLLDDMERLLKTFPMLKDDYWVLKEIKQWQEDLAKRTPSKVLPEDEIEQLGFQASRWLNDFRGQLKNLN